MVISTRNVHTVRLLTKESGKKIKICKDLLFSLLVKTVLVSCFLIKDQRDQETKFDSLFRDLIKRSIIV